MSIFFFKITIFITIQLGFWLLWIYLHLVCSSNNFMSLCPRWCPTNHACHNANTCPYWLCMYRKPYVNMISKVVMTSYLEWITSSMMNILQSSINGWHSSMMDWYQSSNQTSTNHSNMNMCILLYNLYRFHE
jgi:hypothetical protein